MAEEQQRGEGRLGSLKLECSKANMKEGAREYQDRNVTPRTAPNAWAIWPKKKSAFSLQGLSPVLCL